jgi:CheY-like chemotaxis protein
MSPRFPGGTGRRRVLIVEDNADGRVSLKDLLTCWGYQVEVAEDGLNGVQKALTWRPDVALVDIGLPKLDGNELARRVRAQFHDSIRLIALTAYGQPEDRRQAYASGFDAFLCKPADPDELAQLLGPVDEPEIKDLSAAGAK